MSCNLIGGGIVKGEILREILDCIDATKLRLKRCVTFYNIADDKDKPKYLREYFRLKKRLDKMVYEFEMVKRCTKDD